MIIVKNKKAVLLMSFLALIATFFLVTSSNGQQVNMSNYEQLVAKIKSDLPKGTERNVVEEYLSNTDWEHSFVDREKAFYVMVKGVDRRLLIFKTDLWIRIYLDGDMLLKKIDSELINTGV